MNKSERRKQFEQAVRVIELQGTVLRELEHSARNSVCPICRQREHHSTCRLNNALQAAQGFVEAGDKEINATCKPE